jgi:TRAP-type C4-dicarboxylate transport system substrate-binding protein
MKSLWKNLLLTALLGMSALSAQAQTWRMASKMPADTPEGQVFQKFADLTKEYSGGKLTVQVYPAEQLGKEAAVLEQAQLGAIHIIVDSAFFMQRWVPDIKWIAASFLFDDREHWVRFMGSPLVKGWFAKVEKDAGIMTLGNVTDVVRGPYRVIVSKKPINTSDDLRGLKMRMYPDQLATAVWTNLGVETRLLGWTETYEGIKNGVVESVTSPVALVESMRFYEVAPNVVRTNEFWQEIAFMVNAKAFNALPKDLQAVLLRAHKEAGTYSAQLMQSTADESMKRLAEKGVKISTIDPAPIVRKTMEYYAAENKAGRVPAGFFDAVAASKKK